MDHRASGNQEEQFVADRLRRKWKIKPIGKKELDMIVVLVDDGYIGTRGNEFNQYYDPVNDTHSK